MQKVFSDHNDYDNKVMLVNLKSSHVESIHFLTALEIYAN